ncbi:hypothetical protein [Nocardioides solisilvae]|uniref:hypothetical protein n=1 Tax=Nocardioides solisilvae TaxID=1542435 RepID=UPI001EF4530E|nr:hypothetical protein [Nocardioides solisilvae]
MSSDKPLVEQDGSAPLARPAGRRDRHLLDLSAPRPPRDHSAEARSLGRVQRWVLSTLAVTTILHLSLGLVVAAAYVPETSGKVVLCVIAGAFGVIAVIAGLVIHGRRPLTPWLLLGLLPTLVGLLVVL